MNNATKEEQCQEDDKENTKCDNKGLEKIWMRLQPSNLLEKAFYRHGYLVSQHPWAFIVGCLVVTLACGSGLARFQWETNVVKLWNPTSSDNWKNFEWLWKNHPPDLRRHNIIFRADNVLTVENLKRILEVRNEVHSLVTPGNYTWKDVCLKVPVIPSALAAVLTESTGEKEDDVFKNDGFFENKIDTTNKDPALDWYPYPLCTMYNNLERACLEDSILELFGSEGNITMDQLEELTDQDILEAVNNRNMSLMFTVKKDFKGMLGDVVYDDSGKIIGAGVMAMTFYGKMNVTEAHLKKGREEGVFGKQLSIEQLDDATSEVEDAMIASLKDTNSSANFEVLANVAKNFQDSINHQILSDLPKIAGSFFIMFIYVSTSLGKFNCLENRILLAQVGLFAIIMALATSYGLCSLLGLEMSPLHNFIPFLLLGLGVDDMFVIVRAYDYHLDKKRKELTRRISETMKYSGVAITVTSLTDFLAFAIGGTTTIPALKSFCMFCGVGIVSVYIYQSTWFVAWLTIDERRKLAEKYALFPCLKKEDAGEEVAKKKDGFCPEFSPLKWWSKLLAKFPFQIVVISISMGLFGISIYGNILLKQEFDPWLFLPATNPLRIWKDVHVNSFPSKGERVLIISEGGESFDLKKLDWLTNELKNQKDIVTRVDSWYLTFKKHYEDNYEAVKGEPPFLNLTWNEDLEYKFMQFLHSGKGGKYKYLINFDKEPSCGEALPGIETHIMELDHVVFPNSVSGVDAMNRVKKIIKQAGFPIRVFPFSQFYSVLEIDEIIKGELYRNLGLASISIYIATLLLLSSLKGSLFCMISVFCTLANVSGIMAFWDLTIDTVTCTVLIVCIGLSVDFSAHVVHSFMHTHLRDALESNKEPESPKVIPCSKFYSDKTDKKLRMRASIEAVAPAVLHGGLSTLLAVVLLAFSDVYVFIAFFKIFVLVVSFGLYNGLVLLPVLLSLFGPEDQGSGKLYKDERDAQTNEEIDHKSSKSSISAITPLPLEPNSDQGSDREDIT